MAKIQDVGMGKYIRNPQKRKEILRIEVNEQNSYRCHPIKQIRGTAVELDFSKFSFIAIDTNVEEVIVV